MYLQPTCAARIRICIIPVNIAQYSGDTLGAQNIAAHHANLKYRKNKSKPKSHEVGHFQAIPSVHLSGCQNRPRSQSNNEIKFPQSMARQPQAHVWQGFLFMQSKILSSDDKNLLDECNLERLANTKVTLDQESHQYVELSQQEDLLQLKPNPFQMPFQQHTLNPQDVLFQH